MAEAYCFPLAGDGLTLVLRCRTDVHQPVVGVEDELGALSRIILPCRLKLPFETIHQWGIGRSVPDHNVGS